MNLRQRGVRAVSSVLVLTMMLAMVPLTGGASPPPGGTAVFINEIHYDNSGGDTGEALSAQVWLSVKSYDSEVRM